MKLHNLTNFSTNSTHSICGCQRLATFALLAPPAGNDYNVLNGPNISEQNDILVGIMAAIILILAIVVVAILSCYCRKRKVSNFKVKTICFFSGVPQHKRNVDFSTYLSTNNNAAWLGVNLVEYMENYSRTNLLSNCHALDHNQIVKNLVWYS